MTITKEKVEQILLHQVKENGESIWEEFEWKFDGKQEEYLEFLVSNNYITQKQAEDWIRVYKEVYEEDDSCGEYAQIEAMTYVAPADFPYDVLKSYSLEDENCSINLEKARELGLVNVPIVIETEDVKEHNEIYWTRVISVMAHYIAENYEYYKEVLDEILD